MLKGEADEALSAITQSMSGATDQKMSMEELKATTEKVRLVFSTRDQGRSLRLSTDDKSFQENVKIEEQKKIIDEQLSEVEPLIAVSFFSISSFEKH